MKREIAFKKEKFSFYIAVFLFLYAFVLMLFFTESSPLFAINEWVDANAFFTVGKGMANGLVPYRDLFEQKGPLLYALHAIAYTISHKTFLGVYCLESAAMFINLIFIQKISNLYLKRLPSMLVTVIFPVFFLNSNFFRFGDSAEEFVTPFLIIFFYFVLKRLKKESDFTFSWWVYLLNGFMAGCVFWIKFTLIGAWMGFYFALFIIFIVQKKWMDVVRAVFFTIIGLFLSCVPWLFYFGLHHAISDLIEVYLRFNLFMYPSQLSFIGKLINCAVLFGEFFNRNWETKLIMMIGIVDFLFTRKYLVHKLQKYLLASMISFLILGVYIGGRSYPYYYLIIVPIIMFGLISIAYYLQSTYEKFDYNVLNHVNWDVVFVTAFLSLLLCFGYNSNIKESKFFVRFPPAQQTFAKVINQTANPTLLNYGDLDGGFYLAANLVPNVKYFEKQNIDPKVYPENMQAQNRYIMEKKVKFVVIRKSRLNLRPLHVPYLEQNYRLIKKQFQIVEGKPYDYLLYKQKSK
ncbi:MULTISPECIES: hypothetical protein [Heyndrickxia]|jgi:hypothetical protein|uniref:hypothetical protein n=1 Tax=Heyndrickxia TaxID=2837504 RepID=UPI001459761A|nr:MULTISPECIES: hypothetical protein [Heyndrickxia]MED4839844.1 hypothetical protein [Weizmannia sp. CD-2023]MED4867653.1 hypothetical protein [Weizmannia sp. CD-2023]MED4900277.1 hypothetical protein [Weizmannia sp. CD-2023]MED4921194.1 hypothetical protein [Weizmannia sp. CD-2023]NMH84374.1 hypothetical protein [Heyndrickxia coagulans]